jgi:hypothetical protein
MSLDGSDDPVDYTISNAIIELIDGRPPEEIADENGWDLEDVMKIHPDNLSDRILELLADEHYWPNEHIEDLKTKLKEYLKKAVAATTGS